MELAYLQQLTTGAYVRGKVTFTGGVTESTVFVDSGEFLSLNVPRDMVAEVVASQGGVRIVLSDGNVINVAGLSGNEDGTVPRVLLSCGGVVYEIVPSQAESGYSLALVPESALEGDLENLTFESVCRVAFQDEGFDYAPLVAAGLLGVAALAALAQGPGSSDSPDRPDPNVTFDEDAVGGEGTVNASESRAGVTLSGTVDAGATVMVTVAGMSFEATVTGETWSLYLPPGTLESGEYLQDVTVEATDQYGNTREIAGDFAVDTEIDLTVNARSVEGNGIVNAAERTDGVIITGTSDAGATVVVEMNGFSHSVTADAQGRWSVNFAVGEVPAGTYTAPVKVTTEDAAGNQTTVNTSIKVDTEARVAIAGPVETDNVINASEASDGVVLTGTTEPGSVVMVTFGTMTLAATVTASGAWSVNFPASAVEPGTYETVMVANAVDANGNAASASRTVTVDTETFVTVRTATLEGDGTVNFVERADGVTLTGTAEAGATVQVTFAGVTRTVTAGANGSWSADYTAANVPSGESVQTVSVTSTDLAGNTATTSGTVTIDTFVNRLEITSGPGGADGVINQTESGQNIVIGGMVERGSTVTVTLEGVTRTATVAADGSWTVTFPPGTVPGGEYNSTVTVNATDRAGNTSSISQNVRVDTVAGDVTLSSDPIEIDDTVNFVERSDGVLIHGTATPGLTVTVTLGGVAHQVVAGPDGYWESLYTSAEIPQGTYVSAISASITDSAGNTKTVTDSVSIDTEISLTLTKPIEGDNILSGAEETNGLQLSGTVEQGSTVVVSYNGQNYNATVAANGTWTLTVPASAIASGEYTQGFTATATDRAGNTTSITDSVRVDTIVNRLDMSRPVEGDDTINRIEAQDGVTLTGKVEQGSTVVVTFEGTTRTATVAANGTWTVDFAASEIPAGEYDAEVTISATDAVGNQMTITEMVAVDTEISLTLTKPIEGDNILSGAEETNGLQLSGTVEQGSTVVVSYNGQNYNATVAANGTWTLTVPASAIASGEYTQGFTATATDRAGNTTSITDSVRVDTIVNRLDMSRPVEGDDTINRIEAQDGVTLTGKVEQGSTVVVTFEGTTRTATVAANGTWTVDFAASEIPAGEYDAEVTISATDAVGNQMTITEMVAVDTTPPEAPLVESYTRAGEGVRAISTSITDDGVEINTVSSNGTVGDPSYTTSTNTAWGEINYNFSAPIPNGSHLVITSTDDAGNNTSTLFVLEESLNNTVDIDNAGLAGFNIEAIDLQFAEDSQLTLTVSDLEALSKASNSLTVHGGVDDTVTIVGATDTSETQDIGGRTYKVFDFGPNGGSVIIDEDITVVT